LIGGGGNSLSTGSGANVDAIDNLFGGDGNDLLEGDTGNDVFTCDGKNSNTAAAVGTAPGEADIMVDFTRPTGDTGGTDCEF
jgi:Ca2+-binding RTX toxin-like protein